jgi:hypothetical protein
MQDGKVCAYNSKKFTPAEKNYTTTEQELLGVLHALQSWRCYLEGCVGLTLVTDHNPLIYLQAQPNLSRRQARWQLFMARFHYTWEYRPGKNNIADPISRNPALLAAVTRSHAPVTPDTNQNPGQSGVNRAGAGYNTPVTPVIRTADAGTRPTGRTSHSTSQHAGAGVGTPVTPVTKHSRSAGAGAPTERYTTPDTTPAESRVQGRLRPHPEQVRAGEDTPVTVLPTPRQHSAGNRNADQPEQSRMTDLQAN